MIPSFPCISHIPAGYAGGTTPWMEEVESRLEQRSRATPEQLPTTPRMEEVEQRKEQLPTTPRMEEVEQRKEQLPRSITNGHKVSD